MAAKPKIAASERVSLRPLDFQREVLPDGTLRWTHTPPPKELLEKHGKWRPIWCAGFELDENGQKRFHHFESIQCHCPPGPQIQAWLSTAFEIALIGGRGSAKSEATFAFLSKGGARPAHPPECRCLSCAAAISYLAHPEYRFLVLRKNAKDLKDYKKRAERYFRYLGGRMTEDGVEFDSGAYGIFDHLADSDAWEKYQGQEFTRMVIEEANQIPDLDSYLKVLMSCRSSSLNLNEQLMLTLNPGGRGQKWSGERFYKIRLKSGEKVRFDMTAQRRKFRVGDKLPSNVMFVDPETGKTRCYISSTVDDNPYQLRKGYDRQLDQLKSARPSLWKRWRLGDMDVADNQFFEEFRKIQGPGEPANAVHVCKPRKLLSHWPRAIAGDWGYSHKSAVGWFCWTPEKQLHVYDELVVSKVGTVELGTRIAERSLQDLKDAPNHHMVFYLSPDAFGRKDEGMSQAEQIASGINMVLGKNAAFVLDTNEEEEILEDGAAWESVYRRQRSVLNQTHITIVRANNARKAGWDLIHEYLRWWSIIPDSQRYNPEVARAILEGESVQAWWKYKQETKASEQEALPILQIWENCTNLIEGIMGAETKETDSEDIEKRDDDEVDMLRYGVMGFTFQEAVAPKELHIAEQLQAMKLALPGLSTQSLIMAARFREQQADKNKKNGINIPRFAARRRAMAEAMQPQNLRLQ